MMDEENLDDSENLDAEESGQHSIRIEATMEADRDKFMRRTCPDCGLDFKTLADNNDFAWLLHDQAKRQGYGRTGNDESPTIREFCCPYCEAVFDRNNSFTEETINYAKRIIYRDVVVPMFNKEFGDMADEINSRSRSGSRGGFISFSVSMKHERIPQPARPINGPDSADMKIIHFLCCDKKAKILESWNLTKLCVFCRTEITFV
jgi:hypothetical protein